MGYPQTSENTSFIGLTTKGKWKTALELTGGDVQAASNLVLADTLRETNEQIFKSCYDIAACVRLLSPHR